MLARLSFAALAIACASPAILAQGAPAAVAPAGAAAPVLPDAPTAVLVAPTRATWLRDAPDGSGRGQLLPGASGVVVARERGWVKVRVEAWVQERDVTPTDPNRGPSLSVADLRGDPEGTRGKVVRWDVESISLQTADGLRADLGAEEPYLLARGPQPEGALVYLAVPPSLLQAARALPPLSAITVVARVRSGRSEPAGVPILDIQSLTPR